LLPLVTVSRIQFSDELRIVLFFSRTDDSNCVIWTGEVR
jgi:hypothetical protein